MLSAKVKFSQVVSIIHDGYLLVHKKSCGGLS